MVARLADTEEKTHTELLASHPIEVHWSIGTTLNPSNSNQTSAVNGREHPPQRLAGRQYVRFAFYRLEPGWRRLPADEQRAHKRELRESIEAFGRRMLLRPYSLMGTRADAELLLWQIAESPDHFRELGTEIARSRMGGYLTVAYSLFSQTKRSVYEIRDGLEAAEEQLIVDPSEARYIFVYPFIKTRDWYHLSRDIRQEMMDEHIQVGRKYPAVKLNTTYCFGLDDYEFIVAFETDEPSDFLDLVQDLRETEASRYTKQDTPLFAGINMRLVEALDALGGPPIAEPVVADELSDTWVDVAAAEELLIGGRKLVYVAGRQIALFNVDGHVYALTNRCSHARGPLSDGDIDCENGACTVRCPWHDARFDLATGRVVGGIASAPVPAHQAESRDGRILVGPPVATTSGQVAAVSR